MFMRSGLFFVLTILCLSGKLWADASDPSPIAPRRYDELDNLPTTVFSSVTGVDPKESFRALTPNSGGQVLTPENADKMGTAKVPQAKATTGKPADGRVAEQKPAPKSQAADDFMPVKAPEKARSPVSPQKTAAQSKKTPGAQKRINAGVSKPGVRKPSSLGKKKLNKKK
jgi:hypothetical protein